MRKCRKCNEIKNLSEFRRAKTCVGGYSHTCVECDRLRQREDYRKNRDLRLGKAKVYQKSYYKRNKLKIKRKMALKASFYFKRRLKSDPLFKFKIAVRTLIKNSIRKLGWNVNSRAELILSCDYRTLQNYLIDGFLRTYGRPPIETEALHIDHIVPLSLAKTEEDIVLLNNYRNLRYLLKKDNLEKRDKLEWLPGVPLSETHIDPMFFPILRRDK